MTTRGWSMASIALICLGVATALFGALSTDPFAGRPVSSAAPLSGGMIATVWLIPALYAGITLICCAMAAKGWIAGGHV